MTQCGDLYRTSILFVPSFRSPLLCPLNSLGVMGRKGDVSDQRQFSCIILSEDSLTTNHSSNNREYAFSPMICHTFVFLITSGQALSKLTHLTSFLPCMATWLPLTSETQAIGTRLLIFCLHLTESRWPNLKRFISSYLSQVLNEQTTWGDFLS